MSMSKKSSKIYRYQLSGSQKKSGVNLWRFVFNGTEKGTGQERKFFIELYMLNQFLSPNEALLGFKSRVSISAEDLHNVLAGTVSAQNIKSETFVIPSYIALRAGVLGTGAKQVCSYSASKEVSISPSSFNIQGKNFSFDSEKIYGSIECSPGEINEKPELLCDSGSFSWDLRYEIRTDFYKGYSDKKVSWFPVGAKTVFSGSVSLDGKVYDVMPSASCGYIDRYFGKDLAFPWVHISSTKLTSIISGKTLTNSTFAIQGVFENQISAVLDIEGNSFVFEPKNGKKTEKAVWNFSEMPENKEGEDLHWTISLNKKSYVVDIDVFCTSSKMYVKTVEMSEGKRAVLKVLSGGTGTGEIRVYRRIKKNLELIEHAKVSNVLCEFGQKEIPV